MILSRTKAAVPSSNPAPQDLNQTQESSLLSYLYARDYTGALTLLEFEKSTSKDFSLENTLWIGFAAFHSGDYQKALKVYEELSQPTHPNYDSNYLLYLSICEFYLGMYTESDKHAKEAPPSKLQNRLLFHLSHKFSDEKRLMQHHQHLQDVVEDQLTLASIHYLRGHYQEAIDVYKRLLAEHPSFSALNVYMALCYYKLDYYDVSQELLHLYLQKYPDSIIALNLKACNQYKLYNNKAAEATLNEISSLSSSPISFANDVIQLNLAIFKSTSACLPIFERLVDVVPEARLNLTLYHLKNDDIHPAYTLMKDVEPSSPAEYILKAIVNAMMGQTQESREHLKLAQHYFQLVGSSASECDTIAGRQCMASCFFLLRHFEDVAVYLNSIKTYFFNDDTFNLNFAQVKVGLGCYTEAEEFLHLVQNEKMKNSFCYLSHLAKCYVMTKKAHLAWDLYRKMDSSSDAFTLLQMIANDSYQTEQYLIAAKAFDVLERLDPSPEYWEAKRGACMGVLRQVHLGQTSKENAIEVVQLLQKSRHPQMEYLVRSIRAVGLI